jgi:hypothetical protein
MSEEEVEDGQAAERQPQAIEKKKIEPPKLESAPVKFWKDENDQLRFVENEKNGFCNSLKDLTGVKDWELADSIISLARAALSSGPNPENEFNVIIQSEHDFKPKDAIEARLVAQAAVAYQNAMQLVRRGTYQEGIRQIESLTNLGIKFMRVHNETIETLSRYRRGGEQKVTVTHVAEKMAVVNNYGFQGGGDSQGKSGDSPCQQYAEPKPEPTGTNHVDSQPCLTDVAGSTEGKARVRKRKRVVGG